MSDQRWPGFMRPSRPMGRQKNVFHTAYHVMDARGVFDDNPANVQARDEQGMPLYAGPVRYPMMFYHPEGEERVIVQAEQIEKPGGRVVEVGEKREIISRLAQNEAEEAELREEGWHDHPSKAIAKATTNPNSHFYKKPIPPMGADTKIRLLESEVEQLKQKLEEAQVQMRPTALGKKPAEIPL